MITRIVHRGLYECKAVNSLQIKQVHADNLLSAGKAIVEGENKKQGLKIFFQDRLQPRDLVVASSRSDVMGTRRIKTRRGRRKDP